MKRFALVSLSILCLSLTATTSVKAGTRTERIAMSTETATATKIDNTQITPSALQDEQEPEPNVFRCQQQQSVTILPIQNLPRLD